MQSGLSLFEGLGRRDETAKLRYRLGLVHYQNRELTIAVEQLEKAANLLESLFNVSFAQSHDSLSKAEVTTQTYRLLQKVLVNLGKPEEALAWAEKLRRFKDKTKEDFTSWKEIVDKQRGIVLYFSEVDNELYAWCLAPNEGLLRFHLTNLGEGLSLQKRVIQSRDALIGESSDLLDDCNIKMPVRGHYLNASSYSLSSLFSVGSVSSRAGSARWGQTGGLIWQAPCAIQSMYDLILAPFEDLLPPLRKELILVIDETMYLLPFPALQSRTEEDYLCERFSLLVVPSLTVLKRRTKVSMPEGNATVAALVVGNPSIPEKVKEDNAWTDSVSSAEIESEIVAEMLETRPLIGKLNQTKNNNK